MVQSDERPRSAIFTRPTLARSVGQCLRIPWQASVCLAKRGRDGAAGCKRLSLGRRGTLYEDGSWRWSQNIPVEDG
jgi:hypothetical protein